MYAGKVIPLNSLIYLFRCTFDIGNKPGIHGLCIPVDYFGLRCESITLTLAICIYLKAQKGVTITSGIQRTGIVTIAMVVLCNSCNTCSHDLHVQLPDMYALRPVTFGHTSQLGKSIMLMLQLLNYSCMYYVCFGYVAMYV